MKQMTFKAWSILGLALALALALPGATHAAKGGIPGPPSGGETANNLSLPGVQTESAFSIAHKWAVPAAPILAYIDDQGNAIGHYSYGCDQPEGNEQFSYPNTSCVDNLDLPTVYYTAEECVDIGMPCEGFLATDLSRIFWQKVDVNEWWADDDGISPGPAYVAYVDWGDALESNTWTTKSKLRVETQPYSSKIDGYLPWESACADATLLPETDCKVGFQMWHVSGQGITEHWGVRATDAEAAVSYNYDSPFQIIKTSTARLNVAKMVPGDAACPQPGEGEGEAPPEVGAWDPVSREWFGTCTVRDAEYSVETSVGGKYVYGYNLDMKATVFPPDCEGTWEKAGYWRLTFYTEGAVQFTDSLTPNVAPPSVPSEVRELPRCDEYGVCVFNTVLADPPPVVPPIVIESEDPTADGRLYKPVVDDFNNLTYLDICVVLKEQGGGGGGKKPK